MSVRIPWSTIATSALLVGAGVASRTVEHPWNAAPVTAVAIVAGMELSWGAALALPLAIRVASDALIGFFAWPLMVAVYGAHVCGAAVGRWARGKPFAMRAVGAPIISAAIFFLATNFAFLYREYPRTLDGILAAYANGLPFLRGTLLGDVGYTFVLVSAITLVQTLAYRKSHERYAPSV